MSNSRTKRIHKIILGQSLVASLILLIASYLIIYSMGYKINFMSRKIIKTGMIVLSVDVKPDKISINNQSKTAKKESAYQLVPAYYDVKIEKDGYKEWKVSTQVKEELVNYYSNIVLFKDSIKVEKLQNSDKIELLNLPISSLAEDSKRDLISNEYEIWSGEKLLTRYSQKIREVSWYYDNHHIVFQQGNAIKIIDEDGSNEVTLVELANDGDIKYAFTERGKEIIFKQNDEYYCAQIR